MITDKKLNEIPEIQLGDILEYHTKNQTFIDCFGPITVTRGKVIARLKKYFTLDNGGKYIKMEWHIIFVVN